MIRILCDIISTYKVYYIGLGLNFVRPFQRPVLFVLHFPVLHFQSPIAKCFRVFASRRRCRHHEQLLAWHAVIVPDVVLPFVS